MTYRSDIQAFRAIAIILVIAAHFEIPGLSAGFIGVDLFFVISGYVITRLIDFERTQVGRFSYSNFYARRFNRLAPALLVMLSAILVLNYFLNAPYDQLRQLPNAILAAVWSSNIQLAFAKLDYFDPGAINNLFLHTWSLGVEEQFYIAWPGIFLVAYSLSSTKRYAFYSSIFLASFFTCVWYSFNVQAYAYYLMPMRMWQFLIGGMIFLVIEKNESIMLSSRLRTLAHVFGLLALFLSVCWIDPDKSYPGYQAILPTVAAGMLLIRMNDVSWADKIYSLPILQWIGDRSYSLYLWHWPYWYFISSFPINSTIVKILSALMLTLITAELSYRVVENPFRRIVTKGWSAKKTAVFAVSAMVVYAFLVHIMFGKAEQEIFSTSASSAGKYMADLPSIYKNNCETEILSDDVRPCQSGSPKSDKKIILVGDSIGAQWLPAIENIYADQNIISYTKSACTLVDRPIYYDKIGRVYKECESWREGVIHNIVNQSPNVIFMGLGIVNLSHDDWVSGLSSTVDKLNKTGAKIYIFRPTPKLIAHPLECLNREAWTARFIKLEGMCDFIGEADQVRNNQVYTYLLEVKNQYKNVHILDMNDLICQDGDCRLKMNGLVSFRDKQHLTASFVAQLSPKVLEKIKGANDL